MNVDADLAEVNATIIFVNPPKSYVECVANIQAKDKVKNDLKHLETTGKARPPPIRLSPRWLVLLQRPANPKSSTNAHNFME